ncbi:LysR substrate-binding domain-containing protein [Paraburkholderia fungorum]
MTLHSKKRLPPLNTIAAFEAAARLMSFTKGAEELCISQGAVSRQIQILEERIGCALFTRNHREIRLTKAGVIFQHAISQSLASIRKAVSTIEALETNTVTIAASVAMSSFWLMPALIDFRDKHPEINIRVLASDHGFDPRKDPVDLVIRYGDGNWPGLEKAYLVDEIIFPICSKAYLAERKIASLDDLFNETLIDLDDGMSCCWDTWFERNGIEMRPARRAMRVSNHDLAYRAVCAGEGVALGWNYGIPRELRETLLVRPLDVQLRTGFSEYLTMTSLDDLSDGARTLVQWLVEYAEGSTWK